MMDRNQLSTHNLHRTRLMEKKTSYIEFRLRVALEILHHTRFIQTAANRTLTTSALELNAPNAYKQLCEITYWHIESEPADCFTIWSRIR